MSGKARGYVETGWGEYRWVATEHPDPKKAQCVECRHRKGALSWWCYNEKARKRYGAVYPNQNLTGCAFWEPCKCRCPECVGKMRAQAAADWRAWRKSLQPKLLALCPAAFAALASFPPPEFALAFRNTATGAGIGFIVAVLLIMGGVGAPERKEASDA